MEESKDRRSDDEWSDDSDDSGDSDDSDDSDDSEEMDNGKHKKKDRNLNPKSNSIGKSQKMIEKERAKDFFKDL